MPSAVEIEVVNIPLTTAFSASVPIPLETFRAYMRLNKLVGFTVELNNGRGGVGEEAFSSVGQWFLGLQGDNLAEADFSIRVKIDTTTPGASGTLTLHSKRC